MLRAGLCALLLLWGGWSVAAAIFVCAHCGFEYAEGQAVCANCGAALPSSAPVVAKEPPPAATAPLLPLSLVTDEAREAGDFSQAGELWPALLMARQVQAVANLVPQTPPALTAAMQDVVRRAEQSLRFTDITCWACSGRMERITPRMTMKGELSTQALPGQSCPVCAGRGRLHQHPDARHQAEAYARGLAAWRAWQVSHGRVEANGLWLPPGVATNLGPRAVASTLRALHAPCETCKGLGFEGCTHCEGLGRMPCPERDCIMGRGRCPECKGTGRVRVQENGRTLTRTCPRCVQRGIADCARCEGKGYLVCDTCEGRGEQLCSRCQGTARNAECGRCQLGLSPCRTCKGTGKQGDHPCATCRGEGVTLCASCGGSGYRAKR